MRDLDTDGKYTVRYQVVAMARDVLTISAVVTMLSTVFWFAAKPYMQPFLDLPEQVAKLSAAVSSLSNPRLVEYDGYGIILGPRELRAGERATILYHLKRNADCATEVDVSFMNVNTGVKINTHTIPALRAPVSEDFSPFILSLEIPENLPPGEYVYTPRFNPIRCGIYRPYNFGISEPFTVTTSGD